jgi:serine/threonine protein kinase
LGNGAMGVVYGGEDIETGEKVAIKTIRPGVGKSNSELPRRFVREAQALSELDHPNIVNVRAASDDGNYIVMDFVDGTTLAYQIKKHQVLPITPTIKVGAALASALAYIHSRNIIHRDVKPPNIMFTRQGRPILMDFGVAHVGDATPMTAPGSVMGTLAYIAPEMIQGQPATPKSDIWSLGMVLFQMLTGQVAFNANNTASAIAEILTAEVPQVMDMRHDVPPALAGLVDMMLQKEPIERIDTMERVRVQLLRMMSSQE